MTPSIAEKIDSLRTRITFVIQKYERACDSVLLLAVSKTQEASAIRLAHQAGLRDFGENYLQEALEKQAQLRDLALQWHFLGPIQSNKTKAIAENFNWVHSVDRVKIARRLSEQRPEGMQTLNILLQVNIDQETTKSGFEPSQLLAAASEIALLPNIRIVGLMCIPTPSSKIDQQRLSFRALANAGQDLRKAGHTHCTELSMGMSQDYEAAIAEGATIIRIGTGIFGPRR